MFNKVEIIIGGIAILSIVSAFLLLQNTVQLSLAIPETQLAAVSQADLQIVSDSGSNVVKNVDRKSMQIQDVKIGAGEIVSSGDTVIVHYEGRFVDGQVFDSSKKRGDPFSFTVGKGQVIKGWEEGLLGMKVGGERTLVIPPELAYGERGIGPIPGGATLLFTIELLGIADE